MKIVPYDAKKLKVGSYFGTTKNLAIIEEFRDSPYDCVKIEGWTHKSAASCASSFSKSLQRYRIGTIKVMIRKGEVFMYKTHFKESKPRE